MNTAEGSVKLHKGVNTAWGSVKLCSKCE